MKCSANPLEKPKQDRLRKLLAHPDFELFRHCIAAEIAYHEAKAIEAAPWVERTTNGKAAFDSAMKEIVNRRTLLDLLDEYGTENYEFFDVTLVP